MSSNKNPNVSYKLLTSFLQIYNEKFHDLLVIFVGGNIRKDLIIRNNLLFYWLKDPSASDGIKLTENGNTTNLEGATQVLVTAVDEISKQLRRSPNRSKCTIETNVFKSKVLNLRFRPVRDAGSRSHTVYTVKLVKEEVITPSSDEKGRDNEQTRITEGELRFVDLVGVERVRNVYISVNIQIFNMK